MKSVIVYFTHSGNTELAAKQVAEVTGAKMIRLLPEQPYSSEDVNWVNKQSRCTREHLNRSLRPAIKPIDIDFTKVDTLFVGFPIWWHEEPAVIRTFLDNYGEQLKDKVIFPFCTSYESPMSEADATLKKRLSFFENQKRPSVACQIRRNKKMDQTMNTVKLNNGIEMPQMGYGVYQVSPAECERCVSDALSVGYRMIDTAQAYHNEEGVGNAVRKSGIDRKEIFLVSKIWISNYGYEKAKASIDESLRRLQTDYIDLMLLHQPFCDRYGAYRALEDAYKEGKLHAIGVSNFYPDHFIDIASNMEIVPAVNQVETHVFNQQVEAQRIMEEFGTRIMSWGPFAEGRNGFFTNPILADIGHKYGKSVAQVALRWLIQRGVIIIPKSTHVERMRQNIDIFDFSLSDGDMRTIATLDTGKSLFFNHHDAETARMFMGWR